MKKLTTYIAGAPSHIWGLPPKSRANFRVFLDWLSKRTTFIPWAVSPWWMPLSEEKSRDYAQEMSILEAVDLLIALHPTNDGSDRRGIDTIERLHDRNFNGKSLIVAFHKEAPPSKFLRSMFNYYGREVYIFNQFTDLRVPIEKQLGQLADHLH